MHDSEKKIFPTAKDLRSELDKLEGKTIVSTNGCFDILHSGHVKYLEKSKSLGDTLVVLVNTDESVRRLNKGPDRPINNTEDRMKVIAGLSSVDFVCPFSEDTPVEALEIIKPNIHTKGGDYQIEDLPETKTLDNFGSKVVLIEYVDGKSTTNIIKKMKGS